MRLSSQLFKSGLEAPKGFRHQRTSALLSRGLVAHVGYPGIPTYTPIGAGVLTRIEAELVAATERVGLSRVQIPSIMSNADLFAGEPVGEQFHSKILFLSGELDGYHLMTSPEMLLAHANGQSQLSHRDLPVRVSYLTDIFRQMRTTRSILKCRQFRVFGGLTVEIDDEGVAVSLKDITAATARTLTDFGLVVDEMWQNDPLHVELFYPCAEGSTNVPDELALTGRTKALSLAVGYHYAAGSAPVVQYRSSSNALVGAGIATYALCTNRVLYSVFDRHRDRSGFALPRALRPFDVVVVPADAAGVAAADRLYTALDAAGLRTALDDRMTRPYGLRCEFADYIGAAGKLVVDGAGVRVVLRDGVATPMAPGEPAETAAAVRQLLDRVES
jgi:prolyl-tRNA synthetase